jgi:hypothetical protein
MKEQWRQDQQAPTAQMLPLPALTSPFSRLHTA